MEEKHLGWLVGGLQREFGGLRRLACKGPGQKRRKRVAMCGVDEEGKVALQQARSRDAQQVGCGAVGVRDGTVGLEAQEANRSEIIELGVPRERRLKFGLGRPQLAVLHLQFDLLDFQIVLDLLGVRDGLWAWGMGFELRFGTAAQGSWFGR